MRVLLVIGLAALAACGGPTAPAGTVEVTVQPKEVAPGDAVMVTLENETTRDVIPAFCQIPLQRANGEGWSPFRGHAGQEQRVSCIGIGLSIPPGGRYEMPVQLADDLPGGMYRLLLAVNVRDRGEEVIPSTSFTVQP